MLSTWFISHLLSEDLWDRYVDIEHDMIMACARILDQPELLKLWRTNRPEAQMRLERELDQIFSRRWNKTARAELRQAFEAAATRALEGDEAVFKRAFEAKLLNREPAPIYKSRYLAVILQSGYIAVENALKRANQTGKYMTISRLNSAVSAVGAGDAAIDAAIRSAVNDLAVMGIDGYRYPSGNRISLAPYVRREVTTGVMNTTRDLSRQRAEEWGSDLIIVSKHAGARPGCFPYQGRVLVREGAKRTAENAKYPMLVGETTFGQPAGLFGINCRHFFLPWFEGLNNENTEEERDPAKYALGIDNNELYEMTQKQRYNERQIREWKRRAAEIKEAGADNSRYVAKVKYWQKRQREFLESTGLRRDYTREAA